MRMIRWYVNNADFHNNTPRASLANGTEFSERRFQQCLVLLGLNNLSVCIPISCVISEITTTSPFVFLMGDPKECKVTLTSVSDPALNAPSHGSLGFTLYGSSF